MTESPPLPTRAAIIVAAGSSRRMGFDKLSAPLAGIPVLERTLAAFLATECVDLIVVVSPEDRWSLPEGKSFAKPVLRVDGGADRQDSVARGLDALPSSVRWIAVHDGARPLIAREDIGKCFSAVAEHHAVSLARRVTETLKRSTADDFADGSVSRENLWFMETPQVFGLALLREAYAHVSEKQLSITDEVSAVEALGRPVKFIESTRPNLKITTPADLILAEALLR